MREGTATGKGMHVCGGHQVLSPYGSSLCTQQCAYLTGSLCAGRQQPQRPPPQKGGGSRAGLRRRLALGCSMLLVEALRQRRRGHQSASGTAPQISAGSDPVQTVPCGPSRGRATQRCRSRALCRRWRLRTGNQCTWHNCSSCAQTLLRRLSCLQVLQAAPCHTARPGALPTVPCWAASVGFDAAAPA